MKYLFLLVIIFLNGCERSPEAIFQAVFEKDYPSVRILHSQDQYPLDCCIWLHFKIHQSDLDSLLEGFKEVHSNESNLWDQVLPQEVNWWLPSSFVPTNVYLKEATEMTEMMYLDTIEGNVYYVNYLK